MKEILLLYMEKLQKEFGLIPVLGCELEFYAKPAKLAQLDLDLVEEDGQDQFEIRFGPTTDILKLLEDIKITKKKLKSCGAIFAAKPFETQPGSALQMHLNFTPTFEVDDGRWYMNHTIAGLLHTMPELMIFFAPNEDSYKRYSIGSMTAPSHIAWGYNNRTAALRFLKNPERIEHRLAGADADPVSVAAAILFGAYLGLKDKLEAGPPTWGLAFDPQYNLKSLPISLTQAKKNFTNSRFSSMLCL